MKMKSILAALVAVACLLAFSAPGFAAGAEKMGVKGAVTKIEGNKVTVKDDTGKETTVDVKDVKDTKVGDKVEIKEGVVMKMTEKMPEKSGKEKPGY